MGLEIFIECVSDFCVGLISALCIYIGFVWRLIMKDRDLTSEQCKQYRFFAPTTMGT
jgi:hypothetical protein